MTDLTIARIKENEFGTWGVLSINYPYYQPIAVTLELNWKDNKKNISCIPVGTYDIFRRKRKSGKYVYQFKNVPNRSFIQIHTGNYPHDIKGCVLVGEKFSFIKNMDLKNKIKFKKI